MGWDPRVLGTYPMKRHIYALFAFQINFQLLLSFRISGEQLSQSVGRPPLKLLSCSSASYRNIIKGSACFCEHRALPSTLQYKWPIPGPNPNRKWLSICQLRRHTSRAQQTVRKSNPELRNLNNCVGLWVAPLIFTQHTLWVSVGYIIGL